MREQVRSVFSKVFNIDIDKLNDEEITPKKIYLWDSLNHMNFVLSLEERFNTEFTPEEISDMYIGIASVIKIIEKHN